MQSRLVLNLCILFFTVYLSWYRAYFAIGLLNVIIELLDNKQRDSVQILGCQTLAKFIYSQVSFDISQMLVSYIIFDFKILQ